MQLEFIKEKLAKFAIPAAIICCLSWSAVITSNYVAAGKFSNDFSVFWRVASAPVSDAYSTSHKWPFPYPPTMLFWVQPLGLLPKWVAYGLFVTTSLAAYVTVIRKYVPPAAIILCLIAPALVRGAYTGQVSMLMAALAFFALSQRNRLVTGMLFGIIASIKPQLVLMAPLFFAFHREWRAFVMAGATFAVVVILTLSLFGADRWYEWIASLDHFHVVLKNIRGDGIGVTPAIIAEHYGLERTPFLVLGMVTGAAVIFLSPRKNPIQDGAIITVASLLAAPYALSYDLVGILPMLALMVSSGNLAAGVAMGTPFQIIPLLVSIWGVIRTRGWQGVVKPEVESARG